MKARKRVLCPVRIILTSLLFIVIIGQGWIYDSAALAEEDVFEALQISRFPERVEVPDFSLPSTDGGERALSDYKGKLILLNFWTTW